MTEPNSVSPLTPVPEISIPAPTLPLLLQLVHSSTSLAHKHNAKPSRKPKKPAAPVDPEWYECADRNLPSVSSF